MPDGKYTLDPAASALTGAEKLPIVQSSADKHVTPQQIRDYILQAVSTTELSYVDGATSNIQAQINAINAIVGGLTAFTHKQAVSCATTGNITLTGLSAVDGFTPVNGTRVLVWQQTAKSENGIYVARAGAWERAADFNALDDLLEGAIVPVIDGLKYNNKVFICISDSITTVGSSDIEFEEYASTDYVAKTAAYTATHRDLGKTFGCDGTFTFDLPTAVGIKGKRIIVKNEGAGTITVDGSGAETIDGAATKVLSVQYDGFVFQSNGTNWSIVGAF
jgi:hypothetical protein